MLVVTLIRATSKVRLIVRAISCRKKKKKKSNGTYGNGRFFIPILEIFHGNAEKLVIT